MIKRYYELPLKPSNFFSKKEHDTCDIKQSIAHYIHLINTSSFGECGFDETFGCSIWELDFDNLKSSNKLRTLVKTSLEDSLKNHEKRLTNIVVETKIKQEEILNNETLNRIKKRVDIVVKARVKKTNEDFKYIEFFYIGPLSYY
ncbi:GPW/gp25 family protein [uncultured Lacinutrix sp.]|uniref:GPW/gp25 family protein n=1 Tax=uncultured Lacinutrix sp. TaxID=574032 RepID=UPI00261BC245|nr:GPW/gp25 family protein [uncultured Lacinutrix sp.]